MGQSFLFRYQGRVTVARYLREGFGQQFLCLDLMNSLYRDGFGNVTDFLLDSSWTRVFLRHWGFRLGSRASSAHTETARLRTHLRRLVAKHSSGGKMGRGDLKSLNRALSTPMRQRISVSQGSLRAELRPVTSDWAWVRSRVAASFVEVLSRDEGRRLKICPNTGCGWIFCDMTKGGTRRWCNDRRCGNRDRVRRARARGAGAEPIAKIFGR